MEQLVREADARFIALHFIDAHPPDRVAQLLFVRRVPIRLAGTDQIELPVPQELCPVDVRLERLARLLVSDRRRVLRCGDSLGDLKRPSTFSMKRDEQTLRERRDRAASHVAMPTRVPSDGRGRVLRPFGVRHLEGEDLGTGAKHPLVEGVHLQLRSAQ